MKDQTMGPGLKGLELREKEGRKVVKDQAGRVEKPLQEAVEKYITRTYKFTSRVVLERAPFR